MSEAPALGPQEKPIFTVEVENKPTCPEYGLNPRLLQISFQTFRHWKATMEYHKTKDPLYVKEMFGHKKLGTTLLYIQIEKTLFQSDTDEFTVKIAKPLTKSNHCLQLASNGLE